MEDWFKIYIGRLRENPERRNLSLDPEFLEIDEPLLKFPYPIELKIYHYLADQVLICEWEIQGKCSMLCSICGDVCDYPFEIVFSHAEELANISKSVFNFKDLLRDTVLLQIPHNVECGGRCPKRELLSAYLVKEK